VSGASAWRGKVVWITGASAGIGAALARSLSSAGAELLLSGRRVAALETLAADLPGPSLVLPFEATDFAALPDVAAQAWAWRGRINLLVNNAGVSQRSLALDTGFDVYRQLIDVDLLAPIRLTQLVLPRMVEAGGGHVAIVSSLAGKIGVPLCTGYCAAKHACVGYFEALRAEVETAHQIRVSVILPGSVRTDIARNALSADGAAWRRADVNIDSGIAPAEAAEIISAGLVAGAREIIVARGAERGAFDRRRLEAEAFFDDMSAEGARLAAARRDGLEAAPAPADAVL